MKIRRPRSRAKRTARKQSDDPDPAEGQPGQGQPPTPPAPQPDPENDAALAARANEAVWLQDLERSNPMAAQHIRDLRNGEMKFRMRANELKEELERRNAENNTRTATERAAQERELLEQGQHKTLAEQRYADMQKYQVRAIEAELKAELLTRGIDPEHVSTAVKLVDKQGITAGADGTISGIDQAINKFQESNAKLIPALSMMRQAPPPPLPGQQQQAPPANQADFELHAAWMARLYGPGVAAAMQAAKNGNYGAGAPDLPAAGQPAPQKPKNYLESTKSERDDYIKSLGAKDKRR